MNEEQGKIFKSLWQEKMRTVDEDPPKKKADALRFSLAQMAWLGNLPNSPYPKDGALRVKFARTQRDYEKLMDSKDGCNNYADSILELASKCKNESRNWKCTTKIDTLKPILEAQKDEEGYYSNRFKKKDYDELWSLLKDTSDATPKQPSCTTLSGLGVLSFLSKRRREEKMEGRPVFDMHPSFALSDDVFTSEEHTKQGRIKNSSSVFDAYPSTSENNLSCCLERDESMPSCSWGVPAVRQKQARAGSPAVKKYPWEMLKSKSESKPDPQASSFRTASHQLAINNHKKVGSTSVSVPASGSVSSYGPAQQRRSLGARRGPSSKFVPPVKREDDELIGFDGASCNDFTGAGEGPYAELMMDERLKNIEAKMVELIMNEIFENGPPVQWDDIAGLKLAKSTIQEIVVWPLLRPDIFVGLRGPPKGILLFGPPGTGKTMIGKCIASQSQSTFFSISASSLTSKWVGEGEKMVRALFAVARCHQPAVIFIDEIDSLLTQRSEAEHESSRRIKTEFLVQLDGATSVNEERLLVVGATNRPQELDEAARRRLVKRLYIPLPDSEARGQIVRNLLVNQKHTLDSEEIEGVCKKTDGYSGADMANLCREAALGPIRTISFADIKSISVDEVRPITATDFGNALHCIRASVSDEDLHSYEKWNKKYGITPASALSNFK